MAVAAGENPKRSSARATFIVMFCTSISRLLGFARIAVVGAVFGAGGQADVLNAVFTIPNNLRKLMAEGALSSAFIPVLSRAVAEDPSGARPKAIVRNLLTMQFLLLTPVLVLSVLFAGPIINVLLDFRMAAQNQLAVRLFQLIIHYLLLISISALIMGTLNANGRFAVPAITPILFSVFVIGGVLLLWRRLGIFSMAVGVMAGGVAQVLFQSPAFLRLGYGFCLGLDRANPDFRRVLRLWLPVVTTASIFSVNEQIAIRFATGLEEGSASAMANALVFWQLPFGIFAASITTVLFPKLSRLAGADDHAGLATTMVYGLSYLILVLVPCSLLMMLFNKEIIGVALQRGAFTAANTALTGDTLLAFSWGLLPVAAFTLFQRLFYALHEFKTPLVTAVVVVVVDVLLSIVLMETPLRVTGLAHANSIGFTLGLVVMYIAARRRIGRIDDGIIAPLLGWVAVAQLPAVAIWFGVGNAYGDWWKEGSTLVNIAGLAGIGLACVASILAMYRLLPIPFFRALVEGLKRR